jgi:hypothetical protein
MDTAAGDVGGGGGSGTGCGVIMRGMQVRMRHVYGDLEDDGDADAVQQ